MLDVAIDVVLILTLVFFAWLNIVMSHRPPPAQPPVRPPMITELA